MVIKAGVSLQFFSMCCILLPQMITMKTQATPVQVPVQANLLTTRVCYFGALKATSLMQVGTKV